MFKKIFWILFPFKSAARSVQKNVGDSIHRLSALAKSMPKAPDAARPVKRETFAEACRRLSVDVERLAEVERDLLRIKRTWVFAQMLILSLSVWWLLHGSWFDALLMIPFLWLFWTLSFVPAFRLEQTRARELFSVREFFKRGGFLKTIDLEL